MQLANTFESSVRQGNVADTEAIAAYFEGAGLPEKAAPLYAAAADQAAGTLAFRHAAGLFRRALDLTPQQHPARGLLLINLADALANAGRGADAARTYGDAARIVSAGESI